ncbi:MAG: hypothetical protein JW862_02320 [Anaerolineales bacterium]|nr:hypothetical protein [Anaerolineales bacterium]
MDLKSFRDLLTPFGQEVLQAAQAMQPREADFLTCFQQLDRQYPRELARSALEIAIYRQQAAKKFPLAERMYFTRPALEQASSYQVSAYRAERYRGYAQIADLGCSIGADTFNLATVAPTIGIDRDRLRLAMARANLEALEQEADFVQMDLQASFPGLAHPSVALFFDPARRVDEQRKFSVHDYEPPLSVIRAWLGYFPALAVKISPAVKMDELLGYNAEVEFISLHGELKEAVLWFGPLKSTERRATVLPGPHSMVDIASRVESSMVPTLHLSVPLAYLYEPDPAVIRAGLVQTLRVQLGASQLDPTIAYLTGSSRKETPFARCWQVEDWFPFQLKRLRSYLRGRDIGQLTVKKRGSPIQPEELIQSLRLEGTQERVLFLTQLKGNPIVIVALPEQITG